MEPVISRIRRPVRRGGVRRYLLITLLSFAGSVALTRAFLALTGYPQLGNSELHIAHVLWGGLALFAAALLPLIYANRWIYEMSALLAGIGVGLFIDEVGKFITQSNDYFYPAAAPIIYAFFLTTVLLYFWVRKPISRSPRAELYRALDDLEEVLDHDLDPSEQARIEVRLIQIAQNATEPNQKSLAQALLAFVRSEALQIVPENPGRLDRLILMLRDWEGRWISRPRHKGLLVGGLIGLGVISLLRLWELILVLMNPEQLTPRIFELVVLGRVSSASGFLWFTGRVVLEGLVGLLLCWGAVFLLMRREQRGTAFGFFGLLLSLTAVNLLVFYFEQFATILSSLVQFLVLMICIHYRRRFLAPEEAAAVYASLSEPHSGKPVH